MDDAFPAAAYASASDTAVELTANPRLGSASAESGVGFVAGTDHLRPKLDGNSDSHVSDEGGGSFSIMDLGMRFNSMLPQSITLSGGVVRAGNRVSNSAPPSAQSSRVLSSPRRLEPSVDSMHEQDDEIQSVASEPRR
jgi:hypothetical protein